MAIDLTRRALPFLLLLAAAGPALGDDEVILRVYDISDLIAPRHDFPAPRLGLGELEEERGAAARAREAAACWSAEEIVDLIRRVISPQAWDKGDASISVEAGALVVQAAPPLQARVARALDEARGGGDRIYRIDCRLLAMASAAVESFGFAPAADAPALVLPKEEVRSRLAAVRGEGAVERVGAPRLTVYENQRSHFVVSDQSAYVGDCRVDEESGVAEPLIETLSEGLTIEVLARRHSAGEEAVRLEWSISVACAIRPHRRAAGPGGSTIELPEVIETRRQGRVILRADETLAVRGLPLRPAAQQARSGVDGERREMVLLMTCVEERGAGGR